MVRHLPLHFLYHAARPDLHLFEFQLKPLTSFVSWSTGLNALCPSSLIDETGRLQLPVNVLGSKRAHLCEALRTMPGDCKCSRWKCWFHLKTEETESLRGASACLSHVISDEKAGGSARVCVPSGSPFYLPEVTASEHSVNIYHIEWNYVRGFCLPRWH